MDRLERLDPRTGPDIEEGNRARDKPLAVR